MASTQLFSILTIANPLKLCEREVVLPTHPSRIHGLERGDELAALELVAVGLRHIDLPRDTVVDIIDEHVIRCNGVKGL